MLFPRWILIPAVSHGGFWVQYMWTGVYVVFILPILVVLWLNEDFSYFKVDKYKKPTIGYQVYVTFSKNCAINCVWKNSADRQMFKKDIMSRTSYALFSIILYLTYHLNIDNNWRQCR